jgi:hypothetical protein
MQLLGTTRHALAFGLICAGTVGVFGTALADHHMNDEKTTAGELSTEVETFNENRGSLKTESAARAGTTNGEINGSSDAGTTGAETNANYTEAEELSEEVNEYNENGGTLKDESAADTDMNDNLPASAEASGGASAEAQQLDEEVTEYNENQN